MTVVPTTRYAKSGGVHIAYQVTGEGTQDVVLVPGWVSHMEYAWEDPWYSDYLRRLASCCRLILLDRRGTGLSDRVPALPSLEQQIDDLRAVMDAVGSERAALFGQSEGGPMCMMFAATYPARTAALVLYGTFARLMRAPDYPIGMPEAAASKFLDRIEESWGTSFSVDHFAPSLAHDDNFRRSWARFERFAVSPAGMQALMRISYATDARHFLSVIRTPTLILHRTGDRVARVEGGRYLAERIRGATYAEFAGVDHFPFVGDSDAILGEIQEFLTGVRHAPEPDRILATVMFTDIVGSTETAATLGDRRWRDLLDSHHGIVREHLAQFRGREIDTAGGRFMAAFDGPVRGVWCECAMVCRVW